MKLPGDLTVVLRELMVTSLLACLFAQVHNVQIKVVEEQPYMVQIFSGYINSLTHQSSA